MKYYTRVAVASTMLPWLSAQSVSNDFCRSRTIRCTHLWSV